VSGLDVTHSYPLLITTTPPTDAQVLELLDAARRDMVAEGFSVGEVTAVVEVVDPSVPGAVRWHHRFDRLPAEAAQLSVVRDGLEAAAHPGALVVLTASAPTPHPEVAALAATAMAPGTREVDWGSGVVATAVVPAGAVGERRLEGPVVVVSPDMTVAVPPGWGVARQDDSTLLLEVVR
jgi:hypothetical protein